MNRLPLYSLTALCAASFWSTAAVECAAVIALVSVAVQRWNVHETFHRFRLPLILWTAYLLGYAASVIASPYGTETSHSLLLSWHALLFPAVLLAHLSRRDLTIAAYVILPSAALSAAAALLHGWIQGRDVIDSPFVGTTTFADLEVLAFLAGFGLLVGQDHTQEGAARRSLAVGIVLLPIAAAVCRTALKGPVFILLCGSLALVMVHRPRALAWWGGGALLLVLSSPHVLLLKTAWFISGGTLDRYPLWEAGYSLLRGVPIAGYGPGSFARILPPGTSAAFTGQPPSTWHNDYLQVILESGWLTGLFYIALVVSVGSQLVLLRSTERRTRLTLIIVLMCFLYFSTIGSVLSSSVLSAAWWCTLGLIVHLSHKDPFHESSRSPLGAQGQPE